MHSELLLMQSELLLMQTELLLMQSELLLMQSELLSMQSELLYVFCFGLNPIIIHFFQKIQTVTVTYNFLR